MSGLSEIAGGELPEPRTRARKWIAVAILAVILGVAWRTMDPGRVRDVVLILLGAFAFRILMTGVSAGR